ncbi:MAG: hypothetical protein GWO02_17880 [Gammaproteobacteria bacterium]|nr:hypothetical protein [Gammaproteobacteria bacterium]
MTIDDNLARRRRGFRVAPSPFNAVKLELAVLLCVGGLVLVVHGRLAEQAALQGLVLGGYGAGAGLWVGLRTRTVLRRLGHGRGEARPGAGGDGTP